MKDISSNVLFGSWWEIPHPGTLEKIKCVTFDEAMDKWFEGFNVPVLVVDGVREDSSKAYARVKRYYNDPSPVGQILPSGPSGLTVTIVEHPNGCLMRLDHGGAFMMLDRTEAFDLHEKLSAKLGAMPVKL